MKAQNRNKASKLWSAIDGLGDFIDDLGKRLDTLLSERGQIRVLWTFVAFLLAIGTQDNRASISRIWQMLPASGVIYDSAGQAIAGSASEMNGILLTVCSLAMTLLFFCCERNVILGFRRPDVAEKRFKEANRYRLQEVNKDAPTSAKFFWGALKKGEMTDLMMARAFGCIIFFVDAGFQFLNRDWDGNNAVIALNLVYGLAMLVGTEIMVILIQVAEGHKYGAGSGGGQGKESSNSNAHRKGKSVQTSNGGSEVQDPDTGEWYKQNNDGSWEKM